MIQCLRACAVNEENPSLHMVLYYSHMMYKYYFRLGFFTIKKKRKEKIHNEIINNIPQFTRNRLRVHCIQVGFAMYKNKLILHKIEVINPIPYSMAPVNFCQKMHLSLILQLIT